MARRVSQRSDVIHKASASRKLPKRWVPEGCDVKRFRSTWLWPDQGCAGGGMVTPLLARLAPAHYGMRERGSAPAGCDQGDAVWLRGFAVSRAAGSETGAADPSLEGLRRSQDGELRTRLLIPGSLPLRFAPKRSDVGRVRGSGVGEPVLGKIRGLIRQPRRTA